MRSRLDSLAALGFLLSAFVVVPAWAEGLDQRLQALEQKIARLKAEQAETKRELTAAAAALPTFSYRPGRGATVEAADKSWALTFRYRMHVHVYNHTDGNDRRGASVGDLFWRRNRFIMNYCWADCFYEIETGLDADTGDQVEQQYAGLYLHFEKINPYFPTVYVVDEGGQNAPYVARSSTSSAQVEWTSDLLSDDDIDRLSHRAIGVGWLDAPLGQGDFEVALEYKPGAGVKENTTDDSDRQQFFLRAGARPFLRSKNPWLEKLKFGGSLHVDSVDTRQASADNNRLRLRTSDRVGRITVWDTGGGVGDGMHQNWQYGVEWGLGPYLVRFDGASSVWEGREDSFRGVRGHVWGIGHDLFVWSPRGLLTGSARAPGSVQLGFRFARAQAHCGSGADCAPGTGSFSRNRLLQREVDFWYYIRPQLSIGVWWNWWDSANTPLSAQTTIGCSRNTSTDVGKSCDWHTANLGLRMDF